MRPGKFPVVSGFREGGCCGSARAAWYRRWTCMLHCSAAKGLASSLVEVRNAPGPSDQVPSHEVLADAKHFLQSKLQFRVQKIPLLLNSETHTTFFEL